MKGNNGKGDHIGRDDWETPNILFDKLNSQYNFEFDCCATKENSKCSMFSNRFQEIKTKDDFISWMNPPFSKSKEMFEQFFKIVKKGVAIYRCDNMETKIYQDIILKNCDWIFIPQGRVAYYYNPELRQGKGTRFPSALIGIGVPPPKNIKGVVLKI